MPSPQPSGSSRQLSRVTLGSLLQWDWELQVIEFKPEPFEASRALSVPHAAPKDLEKSMLQESLPVLEAGICRSNGDATVPLTVHL